ncbi:uncharacterized protein MONBRDRAFT_33373 [Monosiga brevicollis MX1]|uniref:Cleft lip and palate transmembrane protein 1-like protein n=1 Tax=Monosiga brevicollis TaxID=81824 RepID=A9V521_MONBE|nr:uncharacterized protein MONBRDRAFT_33373 [Monosiga brevicollis MX1]EDQ87198.1 predicted protein [Monosiga brevicollis MX1]|eukprot:XP_001747811.1 hypothetical protein [Monosiga brevicollis MX1]
MGRPGCCTTVLGLIALAYVGVMVVNIAVIWFPTTCSLPDKCLQPAFDCDQALDLYLYTGLRDRFSFKKMAETEPDLSIFNVHLNESRTWSALPPPARINRHCHTLDAPPDILSPYPLSHLISDLTFRARQVGFKVEAQPDYYGQMKTVSVVTRLTKRRVRQDLNKSMLVGSGQEATEVQATADQLTGIDGQPVNHWRLRARMELVTDAKLYPRSHKEWPVNLFSSHGQYRPPAHINELAASEFDWQLLSSNVSRGNATLEFELRPISMGHLRFMTTMADALTMLQDNYGFSDKDLDDVKAIFINTNLQLLALTYAVTILHLVFDYLAFKNDIGFWKGRKDLAGLSRRTILFNFVCTLIIFLYLLDNDSTSMLVLLSVGVSVLVDFWKVTKVLRTQIEFNGLLPTIKFEAVRSQAEDETEQFDATAMVYLGWVLLPLVMGGALYNLVYTPHKSWYSWLLQSLANGVYAFGFVLMTPQLFINYRLKSVAHLPWRVLMYKAFNTFIDDVFSFIVTMPTAHRLACLRDDLVFVVYLYQRWQYPVDKARVNEYGFSYEKDDGTPDVAAVDQAPTSAAEKKEQ